MLWTSSCEVTGKDRWMGYRTVNCAMTVFSSAFCNRFLSAEPACCVGFFFSPTPQYKQCCATQWLFITLVKWNWTVQLWVARNCTQRSCGIHTQTRMLHCENGIVPCRAASFVWVCLLYLQIYFERTLLRAGTEVIAYYSDAAAFKTWEVTSSCQETWNLGDSCKCLFWGNCKEDLVCSFSKTEGQISIAVNGLFDKKG